VAGSVRVEHFDLDGDKKADLTVPGGPKKAVYGHASEQYAYGQREWRTRGYKLGIRLGDSEMIERFCIAGESGDAARSGIPPRIGMRGAGRDLTGKLAACKKCPAKPPRTFGAKKSVYARRRC